MKKYTILRQHDERTGIYYNLMGDRFIPFTDALMNTVTAEAPIAKYDDKRTAFITIKEEINPSGEMEEVQVECFIIIAMFNNIEEVVTYETEPLLQSF
jgi:hypothetical protein